MTILIVQRLFFIILAFFLTLSSGGFCQNLNLKIYGSNTSQNDVIDALGYKTNHVDYTSISNEIDSIQKKLFKAGYIENEVFKIEKKNDTSFVSKIDIKKKYDTIYIYYNKNDLNTKLLNAISSNITSNYFTLKITQIESALNYLNKQKADFGFPFSKLNLSNIRIEDNNIIKADLILNTETKKRNIDKIILKGYDKFPESYLKYFLKIKPNQVFDLSKIKQKAKQLDNLRFAKQIKSPEVLFTKDSTILYMYLEKTKSNTFDGFLGFSTDEQTNKLDFNGYLNLNLINNLNFGESFSLQYKSTQSSQSFFQVDINMPYFLKTPIGIDLQLYIFKQDSSFNTVNQSAKIRYQINSQHTVYTGIKASESNDLLQTNLNTAISDYKSNYISFAYQFTKPQYDNFLFPVNSRLYVESNFGKRKTSETIVKQTQLSLESFKIFNLNQKNSIFLRLHGSSLLSNTYFDNELFRFGGINSIRGFQENSIMASSYGFVNSEYRYRLTPNIYIHSIIDVASFENKITNTKEKLVAYGFGFGILSNAGLLKLNYANGKTGTQNFKFSNSQLHLSFSYNF